MDIGDFLVNVKSYKPKLNRKLGKGIRPTTIQLQHDVEEAREIVKNYTNIVAMRAPFGQEIR